MAGKRKSVFSNRQNRLSKIARQNETPEQCQARIEARRQSVANESPAESQARLDAHRQAQANYIVSQSSEQRSQRLAAARQAQANAIANETPEQRELRLEAMHLNYANAIANESVEERTIRIRAQVQRNRVAAANSTQRQVAYTQGIALRPFNEADIVEHYCGLMNVICQFCGSTNFMKEKPTDGKFNSCCHKGKAILPLMNEYPELLKDYLVGNNSNSSNFMENIRSYNSAVAFASMGAQVEQVAGRGPYCYRIHGQIYHRTSGLHPTNGEPRKYAQLYILDTAAALEQRMNMIDAHNNEVNKKCLSSVMDEIASLLNIINPYAEAYKMMRDFELEETRRAAAENRGVREINMWIHQDKNHDKRRYNDPSANEVAIVFRTADGEPPIERDICIHPRGEQMQQISFLSPNCDPMVYPILFPFGDKGWEAGTSLVDSNIRSNVTHLQFYSSRLSTRNSFNAILRSGKLFQQYAVDAYCKIEANRLNFVRQNQQQLRSDLYSGLMDHVNNRSANEGVRPGIVKILPSSFQGSPRAMQQNFQDAMAIVRKYGKPDLFTTFTCNPKWNEITENLEPGERAENRPDLVARVFNLKLAELLDDILKKRVLGHAIAHVYVIEFQKRGLPHCHLLFVLANEDKPRTVDKIDQIVCAEIPDPITHPRLHQIVIKNMVHGPCGTLNTRSPCMNEKGECTKSYPKDFSEQTKENVDGYPVYRRRDDGRTIDVGNCTIDNRWIVPYNKYLTLKFNAHINVEICSSIKSVKYLYKYVYKGHDCANLKMQPENGTTLTWDEPSMFVDSRYISAPEALWRIRENKMHDQSHTIIRLAVHLPGQQRVTFREGNEVQALQNAEERGTTLTDWFELNKRDANANQYLYQDIPTHYVYSGNKWKTRQRGHENVISRMYSVSPSDAERYFLRLLLLHVKGAKSFDDVKTVDGVVCETYREAARLRNLLCDDTEWDKCLSEASLIKMPSQLRELFGVICALCSPSDPLALWQKHKPSLIEDFMQSNDEQNSELLALAQIQQVLILHGKLCSDFGLPTPPNDWADDMPVDLEAERVMAEEIYSTLNPEQKVAFDKIMNVIENPDIQQRCFFLDGPGGSGKSFTYNALIRALRAKSIHFKSVALTGIAAELLIDGRTCHSTFGIPLKLTESSVSSITATSKKGRALIAAMLIIWDECTMASSLMLSLVDRLLRDLMKLPNTPFGGKVMLLGGHFCQTLPVVKRGIRTSIVGSCLRSSPLWQHFTHLVLHKNMRADPSEQEFAEWILKVGNGELLNSDDLGPEVVEIPSQCIVDGNLIDFVFGKKITREQVKGMSQRAILCPKNTDAILLNEDVLNRLEGGTKTYLSVDEIKKSHDGDEINYPVEFLNSVTPSGMPTHKLNLKIGASIMLLRNMNANKGLCNGTRLIVVKLLNNLIEAEIVTGKHKGDPVFIPRIGLDTMDDSDLPFDMHRRQFPLRLAYAITINRSQGQTLEKVGIFLPEPVFTHGQLYVALSRAKSFAAIKVKILPTKTQGKLLNGSDKVFTQNIVYQEVLQREVQNSNFDLEELLEGVCFDDMDFDAFDESVQILPPSVRVHPPGTNLADVPSTSRGPLAPLIAPPPFDPSVRQYIEEYSSDSD